MTKIYIHIFKSDHRSGSQFGLGAPFFEFTADADFKWPERISSPAYADLKFYRPTRHCTVDLDCWRSVKSAREWLWQTADRHRMPQDCLARAQGHLDGWLAAHQDAQAKLEKIKRETERRQLGLGR